MDKEIFKTRGREIFHEYLNKIRENEPLVLSNYKVNNLIVELRNQISLLIDEIFRKIKVKEAHGIELNKHSKFKIGKSRTSLVMNKACEICGENRTINICHIIPREHGGHNNERNYIYLCPTHHFLFDQARLSSEEFSKILISDKPDDVVEYYNKIHHKRHQLFWLYETNKFHGCDCGSSKFKYDTTRNGNYVQVCLKCINCGLKWCNLWIETHPITRASLKVYELLEEIATEEKERRYRAAEDDLKKIIEDNYQLKY